MGPGRTEVGAGMIRRALTVAALALGLTLTAAPVASAHPYWECRIWHGTNYCDSDAAMHRATERKEAERR